MKIGIIGCGNVGGAIAECLAAKNTLLLYDHNMSKAQQIADKSGAKAAKGLQELVEGSNIVVLAVKPKDLSAVERAIGKCLKPEQLLASTLAGITIHELQSAFGRTPILRLMPNLAISCGSGVVGLCASDTLNSKRKKQAENVFSPLGLLQWLPESQMDALTSLTGSGLGFACVFIEAMVDAAIAMGFSSEDGRALVYEMLKGTLAMLESSGQHPGELKWRVTSPSGTTIAGIRELEACGVRSGIIETFMAAYNRAKQIHD